MKKKISNKKGFTLVEALVATAILAIFVSMAIMGTNALFGTGEQMMSVSKAAVLGSDVMKAVTNEVRFGENFTFDGSTIKYNSASYGDNCKMEKSDDGQLVIVQTSTGTDIFGGTQSSDKTFNPIGSAAYGEVRIDSLSFILNEIVDSKDKNKKRQVITCSISITSDGENILWKQSVDIVPLYQKTVL